jgi:hypothetical protein
MRLETLTATARVKILTLLPELSSASFPNLASIESEDHSVFVDLFLAIEFSRFSL